MKHRNSVPLALINYMYSTVNTCLSEHLLVHKLLHVNSLFTVN